MDVHLGHSSVNAAALQLLIVVHYAAPIASAFTFAAACTYRFCKPAEKTVRRPAGLSKVAIFASFFITATFAARSILYIYGGIKGPDWWAPDHEVVYVLLQTLLWGTLSLMILDGFQRSWTPYAATWMLSGLLDLAIFSLSHVDSEERGRLGAIHAGFQYAAIVVVFGLVLVPAASRIASAPVLDDETQPLLGSSSSPVSRSKSVDEDTEDNSRLGSVDGGDEADSDSEDDDEEETFFHPKYQARLEESGGWLGYAKQYLIFWPYIWPSRNAKFQLFIGVLAFNTLAERALNVLYPRQLGIVIDKLYHTAGTGEVPWRDLLLYLLLQLLASGQCGLPSLSAALDTRITKWSHLQLSVAAFDHVMRLPMSFHDSKDSGEVIKAVDQAGSLSSVLRTIFLESAPFVLDIIIAMWYVTYLLDIYATIVILFVGISFLFVTYHIGTVMQKARRVSASTSRAESRILYEMISNWATVSYFNRNRYEQGRLSNTIDRSNRASIRDNDLSIILFGAQEVIEIVGRLMISVLAAYRIARGAMPVGNFVALESYWSAITMPLWILAHSYRQLSTDLIDAERLLQLFKQTSNITDGPAVLPSNIRGKIEFADVSFAYKDSRNTIDGFSFVAEAGQTVALVGETGAGKSTILKLLMRFYDVTSGKIEIDGQDIRGTTVSSLRDAFGFVPQNAALFNMSILDNVRYGRLDATDTEVHEACKAAAIHDKILTFPEGYRTKVGERGVKLSGGELQRVAIARVILKNPQIVLLDEATSALDSQTEATIQQALKRLTHGRTTVMIAHRLSTVREADLILVVDNGRIVERGTHRELLKLGGNYVKHWERQTSSETEG